MEIDEKRLRKKGALIKTDYEKGRLQLTPAGHLQLATPRANYFLLVSYYQLLMLFLNPKWHGLIFTETSMGRGGGGGGGGLNQPPS
jgi:hypothetical protein